MTIEYKIRFHHGVGDDYKPIHTYVEINENKYLELIESIELFRFIVKTERAYQHIIENYHDFEENIFSVILKNEIFGESSANKFRGEYNSFTKHLLNLLTSTYLYTSVLKINRISEKKKNEKGEWDYDFENSTDAEDVYDLKISFKRIVNNFHESRYQFTFMSALRNKLNHGGTLTGDYKSGGYWSLYWDEEKSKKVGIRIKNNDQRFSNLDLKLTKDGAKQIIKKKYFDLMEEYIPDDFYLRETNRIYLDSLSKAHNELRLDSIVKIKEADKLIQECLTESKYAVLIKYENGIEIDETNLSSSIKTIEGIREACKAPLHIEFYAGMPGEHREIPILDKPVQPRG